MKRFLLILFVSLFVLSLFGCTGKGELPRLSLMDKDVLLEKLTELGVKIPEGLSTEDFKVNELVAELEKEPDKVFVADWTNLTDLTEQVRTAVKLYYGDKLPLE